MPGPQPKEEITRRQLIGVAAGLALPAIVPEGIIYRRGRTSPADRIVFGHIGCGGMGSSHIQPDAAALCDVDDNHLASALKLVEERREKAGRKSAAWKTPALVKDFRRLLDRKDIDAVTIATPDHWHAIMAVMACQAGKDVYTEKPTCKTIEEGRVMVNAARRHKRIVQVGMQGRSHPMAVAAAEFVRNGGIGKVRRVEIWHPENLKGVFGEEKSPPPELDWEMWLGPARWMPYNPDRVHFNFRWYMDYGEGFIRDRGNHALSTMNLIIGNDAYDGLIHCEATGKVQTYSWRDAPYAMEVKWELPARGLTITWSQPGVPKPLDPGGQPGEWGANYYGEEDSLVVFGGDGGCDVSRKAKEFKVPPGGVHVYLHPSDSPDPTQRHRENWYDCIRTRKLPVADIDLGRRAVTLCILSVIAYRLRRKVTFDAAKERFVGDDEANLFLSTPYRYPWKL